MIQSPPCTRGDEAVCFLPMHAFLGRAARPPLQCVQVYSVAHGCDVMQSKATCLITRYWVSFTGLWLSLAELTALPGNTPCSRGLQNFLATVLKFPEHPNELSV
jgi:hypothetical protein